MQITVNLFMLTWFLIMPLIHYKHDKQRAHGNGHVMLNLMRKQTKPNKINVN